MLFVCLSSLDRDKIVKPLLYHLYTFGLNIWYDHKKLFLSDTIEFDVYKKGIEECSDILIIYSKNLTQHSECGRKELDVIYKNKDVKNIYPVLFESDLNDYSGDDRKLLSNTIHYSINEGKVYEVAVQIAIKLLKNLLKKMQIDYMLPDDIINTYNLIPPFNLREKVVALLAFIESRRPYSIDLSISNKLNIRSILQYFYSFIKLKIDVSENDVKLLELLAILIRHSV